MGSALTPSKSAAAPRGEAAPRIQTYPPKVPGNWREFITRRTVLIQLTLLSFLAGLGLARLGWSTNWQLVLAAGFGLVLVWRRSHFAGLALLVLSLSLGIWRGQTVLASFAPITQLIGQKVTLVGVVADDPSATSRYQTEFRLDRIVRVDGEGNQTLPGQIKVRGFPDNKLSRGDVVEVAGKLALPYGNVRADLSFGEVKIIGQRDSFIERKRSEFFAGNNTALPEPLASLGMGFLVGLRSLLPDSLVEQLRKVGLVHIVAVSGYNLTILVRMMRRLFADYSKYIATALSVGLIIGFMTVTGVSPSIFRAAVVSGLSLAAWYYGRAITPMMILVISAAVTAGINPTYLWQDIGWYLSFLAFFGVLVLSPVLTARFYGTKSPPVLVQLVFETTCAQIMVMPLILLIFGELSVISLLANVLILPFIPLAMLLTFIAALAGMLLPNFVGWFAWPARLVLDLIVRIVNQLSQLPWASVNLEITTAGMIWFYLGVVAALAATRRRIRESLDPYFTVVD